MRAGRHPAAHKARSRSSRTVCNWLAEVHNHFAEAKLFAAWQEVPAEHAPGSDEAAHFRTFQLAGRDDFVRVEHHRHDNLTDLLVGQVARLCQDDHSPDSLIDANGL